MSLEKKILIIGPSSHRKGGIASVLKLYKKHVPAIYFSSTIYQNTLLSFVFFPVRIAFLIVTLLANKQIRLVHIHGSSKGSFYRKYIIYLIVKLFNKKVLYHIHSGRYENFYKSANGFIKKRIKKLINSANGIIILSDQNAPFINKNFTPKKLYVLGNMIEDPLIKEQKTSLKKEKIKFLFLGKIFEAKGIYDLLNCIVYNYDLLASSAEFIIAGNGEEKTTLSYKKNDNKNIIHFTGWVNEESKKKLLHEIDVLILPSHSEALPVSVLEAMSYQKAVIATAVGGVPEIVKNNDNGRLIPPKSADDLLAAIMFYINNPEIIKKHGKEGFKMAQQFFPNKIAEELERIYWNTLYNNV